MTSQNFLFVLFLVSITTILNFNQVLASPPPPPNARCPGNKFGIESLLYSNTSIGAPKAISPTLTAWGQTLIATYGLDKTSTDIFIAISQDGGSTWKSFSMPNSDGSLGRPSILTDGNTVALFTEESFLGTDVAIYSRIFNSSSLFGDRQLVVPRSAGDNYVKIASRNGFFYVAHKGVGSSLVIKSYTPSDGVWLLRFDENSASTFQPIIVSGGYDMATDGTGIMACANAVNITCVCSVDGRKSYRQVLSGLLPPDISMNLAVASTGVAGTYLVVAPIGDSMISYFTKNNGGIWATPKTVFSLAVYFPKTNTPFSLFMTKDKKTTLPPTTSPDSFVATVATFVWTLKNDSLTYATHLNSIDGTWSSRGKFIVNTSTLIAMNTGPSSGDGFASIYIEPRTSRLEVYSCISSFSYSGVEILSATSSWVTILLIGLNVVIVGGLY
jgi:hypothetical protein